MTLANRVPAARIDKAVAESGLPLWTRKATLKSEGFLALREIVTTSGYRTSDGLRHFGLTSVGSPAALALSVRATALLAKEMAVTGVPVYYTPMADLARELRLLDYGNDPDVAISAVLARRGDGYLVVPDFHEIDAFTSRAALLDAMAFLMQHARNGGGLVLGCLDFETPIPVPEYGAAFAAFAIDFMFVQPSQKKVQKDV